MVLLPIMAPTRVPVFVKFSLLSDLLAMGPVMIPLVSIGFKLSSRLLTIGARRVNGMPGQPHLVFGSFSLSDSLVEYLGSNN